MKGRERKGKERKIKERKKERKEKRKKEKKKERKKERKKEIKNEKQSERYGVRQTEIQAYSYVCTRSSTEDRQTDGPRNWPKERKWKTSNNEFRTDRSKERN